LVRSAGGDKRVLLGRKKEERELGDARILGSGNFVSATLQQSEKFLERKYRPKKTIDDLIMVVAGKVGVSPELICSRSRQKNHPKQELFLSYLAVEEIGYPAADVARFLGVKRMSVHEAVTRGKTLCTEYVLLGRNVNNLTNLPTSSIIPPVKFFAEDEQSEFNRGPDLETKYQK